MKLCQDQKKTGQATLAFRNPPVLASAASVVGPKEGEGPLGSTFDIIKPDPLLGEKSWEKAESKILQEAAELALKKTGLEIGEIDFFVAGDLLNQIIASNFAARAFPVSYLGIYGACSTFALGLAIGSICLDGGFGRRALIAAGSHHDTAERQFRFPTELGVQRTPTCQWTITGAGAVVLSSEGNGPRITHATLGRVQDMGMKDPNDMGTAMAPAAADTILRHLEDTRRQPEDYDLIITGDLGAIGHDLVRELLRRGGVETGPQFHDCGIWIYSSDQKVDAGGSGCGCSAVVFCGRLLEGLKTGEWRRIMLVSTGCLHSPTSFQQGESLPGVAHAICIENE